MSALRAVLVLVLATALQAALGRFWASSPRFLDLLAVPVVWYGGHSGARAGMLAGCGAGLLEDAWFQAGPFGLNGFEKTLLGWVVGAVAERFDLGDAGSRFLAGALFAVAETGLDVALRRLFDLHVMAPGVVETAVRAVITGCLVIAAFRVAERFRGGRRAGGW